LVQFVGSAWWDPVFLLQLGHDELRETIPNRYYQRHGQKTANEQAPPWPGDSVIVVDAGHAAQSHIVSPQVLPFTLRNKFSTLIADVATTGNSVDPNRKCLLGIMSRKITSQCRKVTKTLLILRSGSGNSRHYAG
jgi:hypothetical protein